jgi:amino acid permease
MLVESVLTLVPAFAVIALVGAVGYTALSCALARVQGRECRTC